MRNLHKLVNSVSEDLKFLARLWYYNYPMSDRWGEYHSKHPLKLKGKRLYYYDPIVTKWIEFGADNIRYWIKDAKDHYSLDSLPPYIPSMIEVE